MTCPDVCNLHSIEVQFFGIQLCSLEVSGKEKEPQTQDAQDGPVWMHGH